MKNKIASSKKVNKKIMIITALILIIAVTCVAVIPFLNKAEINNYMYADGSASIDFDSKSFDVSFGDNVKFLFNSKDSSLAVCSSDYSSLFFSHSQSSASADNAALFTLRLRDKKGNSYFMNSSSNSVAFDTFEVVEKSADAISLQYQLFCNENDAKQGTEKCSVYAVIPFELTFLNGRLTASVDISKVDLPKGFCVEKISLLPGIFSVSANEKGTKYIVPDGCGALIDLSEKTKEALNLKLNMYGEDVAFHQYSQGANLPFFAAINSNGFSLNAIIEKGDALSQLVCKKYENGGGYIYNTFTVTACGNVNGKFVFGESYNGIVSQTYIADEKDATYSTVSAQVRDSLIERGYINGALNSSYSELPFFVNVIGSSDGDSQFTTFEDAAEIAALLKSRGVRSLSLRFSGYGKDGLSSESYKPAKALGGADGLSGLCAELEEQGNDVYFDTNILVSSKGDGVSLYEDELKYIGATEGEFSLLEASKTNKSISKAYDFISGNNITGACINDASYMLYTDLSGRLDRQGVLDNLKNGASALSACGSLMLDYPAVYLSKNADAIYYTPNSVSCQDYTCVKAIPVLQMVLHGSVVYGSEAINTSAYSYEDAMLKCIEYGCVPSFVFTHSGETPLTYSTYATQTSQLYKKAKQLLPVMDMQITSHEEVTEGVYKITYDYSKVFYVNYNPSVVEVNGIMISAKDFVVI